MAFEELKQKQSVMWGSGEFERIEATILDVHETLVDRLRPKPGERWLDVACGTGAVAMRAARAGADVTGVDLAPDLIATAKRRAEEEGLDIHHEAGIRPPRTASESRRTRSSRCGNSGRRFPR